jgi:hypothetical protein
VLDELKSWSQYVNPQWQATLLEVGVALIAFLAGQMVGRRVARGLAARGFDGLLRATEAPQGIRDPERSFTPSWAMGILVRATLWAAAAWWLLRQHGRTDLTGTIELVGRRVWGLTAVLFATLALGSLLARRLVDGFQGGSPAGVGRNGAPPLRSAAGLVGVVAYALSGLLVLLIATDMFEWPLTRSSAQSLWQLAQQMLTAGAALFIACLGARYARDLATSEGAVTPEKRVAQTIAMGVVTGTTVIGVGMLLFSSAGMVIGVVALVLVAGALWFSRGYLPDVAAGLQLRLHRVREVWFDDAAWEVFHVGLLSTEVCREGQFHNLHNRQVLDARGRRHAAQVAAR